MNSVVRAIRQCLFPAEFRIYPHAQTCGDARTFLESLAQSREETRDEIEKLRCALDECKTKSDGAKGVGVPKKFAIELANQCFRIHRNIEALNEAGVQNKETRMLNRTIDAVQRALADQNIESIDLTGRVLDDGQRDFEMVGEPEKRSDLTHATIVFCERPAVMLDGRLVQAARGIVAIPE
ncbi:hypothetical protein ACFL1X_00775 [Candidatus Hydrogenedentota bacterium]